MSWEKDGCEYHPIEGLSLLLQSYFSPTFKKKLWPEKKKDNFGICCVAIQL